MGWLAEVVSNILLFFLVFGMSATVELKQLRKQINNSTALLIGVSMQFLILPFIGFLVVKALNLPAATGITLLVVTSSPGGSYSNWWCSLFNAELSLSVTMTAISTLLSTIMLPTNLILYTRWTYTSAVVKSLDWSALFVSLVVVLGGISLGLVASGYAARTDQSAFFHRRANLLGNIAGLSLITLSISVSSSDHKASLWEQDTTFFVGVALPASIGLAIATTLATKFDLEKPERVAVAVESCFQNTGIATSVALTMFSGNEDELATAIGVPLLYGIIEAVLLAGYCLVCWKIGWTKAPADENLCVVLYNSYEVEQQDRQEMEEAIEVVLGAGSSKDSSSPNDLVFSLSEEGSYVVDNDTLEKSHEEEETERTQDSLDDSEAPRYHQHGGNSALLVAPISPKTESSGSSCEEPEVEASFVLALEDQDRQPRNQGRLGRTISTLRARATGYKHAPVVPCIESSEELSSSNERDTQIQTLPFETNEEKVDNNVGVARAGRSQAAPPSPSYEAIPMGSPDPQNTRKNILLADGKQLD